MIASAARYTERRPVSRLPFARCASHGVAPRCSGRRRSAIALGATVVARGRDTTAAPAAVSWLGLVGEPRARRLAGQRSIVLLNTPSVAQRLARVRYATESQERSWTTQAFAAQQQVLTKLAALGVIVRPDFSYARVIDGFAAVARPARDLAARTDAGGRRRLPGARCVPRVHLGAADRAPAFGRRAGPGGRQLPGFDGRGVTIALLDTGVDESHPYLRGKVLPGIDIVDGTATTRRRARPAGPGQIERHGTELAGILVGSGGPGGLHGVAPGATLLPDPRRRLAARQVRQHHRRDRLRLRQRRPSRPAVRQLFPAGQPNRPAHLPRAPQQSRRRRQRRRRHPVAQLDCRLSAARSASSSGPPRPDSAGHMAGPSTSVTPTSTTMASRTSTWPTTTAPTACSSTAATAPSATPPRRRSASTLGRG